MAKKAKITAAEHDAAHKTFMATVGAELPGRGLARLRTAIRKDGAFTRRVCRRYYAKYLDEGGKAGDWKEFAQWLLENLPAIIAALMAIFA